MTRHLHQIVREAVAVGVLPADAAASLPGLEDQRPCLERNEPRRRQKQRTP